MKTIFVTEDKEQVLEQVSRKFQLVFTSLSPVEAERVKALSLIRLGQGKQNLAFVLSPIEFEALPKQLINDVKVVLEAKPKSKAST